MLEKKDHLFQKGKSGNPAGRPKGSFDIRSRIPLEFAENNRDKIEQLLLVMLAKGLEGDVPAAKLVCEYVMVKPRQEVDLTSDDQTIKLPKLTPEQLEELAKYERQKVEMGDENE